MQQLLSNPVFLSIMFQIEKLYRRVREDDLVKNVCGLMMSFLLVFGFVNISTIFTFMTIGLLLYSIREIMVENVKRTENYECILNTNYLWITLVGAHMSYNLLWSLFNLFGGYLMTLVVNLGYTILLSKLINDLREWFKDKNILENFNMKDFDIMNSENKYSKSLISQVNFMSKLYSINSKICDEIVLKYGTKLMAYTFDIVQSGSIFGKELVQIGYYKLYEFSKDIKISKKNNKTLNESSSEFTNNHIELCDTISNEKANDSDNISNEKANDSDNLSNE